MRKIERPSKALILCTFLIVFPAACFAAPDGNANQTRSEAISLYSSSAVAEKTAWSHAADATPPQQHAKKREAGLIGAGIRLSTLGAGAEVGVSLSNGLNVRGGFNMFQYSRGFNHDGIAYKGQLNLRSGEAHLDWYPIGHTFHLSPGLLVYNGNGATATANVPGEAARSRWGAQPIQVILRIPLQGLESWTSRKLRRPRCLGLATWFHKTGTLPTTSS